MCLIIYKPNADSVVPDHIISNAERTNPDGFGVTFLDGRRETVKTMDYDEAKTLINSYRPLIAHYRYATVGDVHKANCHPFGFKSRKNKYLIYSNGTVGDLGDDVTTDTEIVGNILSKMPKKYWKGALSITETRFAIVHPNGTVERHGMWHKRDGVLYSKSNCFAERISSHLYEWGDVDDYYGDNKGSGVDHPPSANPHRLDVYGNSLDEDDEAAFGAAETKAALEGEEYKPLEDCASLEEYYEGIEAVHGVDDDDVPMCDTPVMGDCVAVYGTLKKNRGNHRLLAGAEFVGHGQTMQHLRMEDLGVPYLYRGDHADGNQVIVEIYKPDTMRMWYEMDCLEGHPDHYKRELVDIEMADGTRRITWVYFSQSPPNTLTPKYIAEY